MGVGHGWKAPERASKSSYFSAAQFLLQALSSSSGSQGVNSSIVPSPWQGRSKGVSCEGMVH